ncbi:MAG: YacC family pilotin-like protein [Morganella sp. (in: enterobacteria)]|uniref:YacC family pilotin-like protein n=1 Tax=Morganella psychrotolerans TaxID=368603 RepID=A0A1B8HA51_9GAMM|nr:YacC family pilotin-like protein [Morganella psychrotolerans]OBU05942.1 hypothetical protein AYY17_06300 [Morganella psychrotolerans]OBU06256.1 hypothetical protein AYY18_07125 [Morganella psychrotolerans]
MKILLSLLISFAMLLSLPAKALTPSQAEDLAGLTAVFIYLKNDCGYQDLQNSRIEKAILLFAQSNRWDMSNYNIKEMAKLNKENYLDIKEIKLSENYKCTALARDSLSLLAYVK